MRCSASVHVFFFSKNYTSNCGQKTVCSPSCRPQKGEGSDSGERELILKKPQALQTRQDIKTMKKARRLLLLLSGSCECLPFDRGVLLFGELTKT